jgi:hypothetical protein
MSHTATTKQSRNHTTLQQSSTFNMTSTGQNTTELKELTQIDKKSCVDVQGRIDDLRAELSNGRDTTKANVLFGVDEKLEEARQVSKDLTRRIETIYDLDAPSPTDREMLQALNARQVARDQLIQLYAELSALQSEACGYLVKDSETEEREFLKAERELGAHEKIRGFGDVKKYYTSDKKSGKEPARAPPAEEEQSAEIDPMTPLPTPPMHAGEAPDLEDVAEPIDPRDVGAAPYATEDDDQEYYEEEEECHAGPESWPLLYQILDLDPATDPDEFNAAIAKYVSHCFVEGDKC